MDDPPGDAPDAPGGELNLLSSDVIASADAGRLRAFAALDEPLLVGRSLIQLSAGVEVDAVGVRFRADGEDRSAEIFVGLLAEVAESVSSSTRDAERFQAAAARVREIRRAIPTDDPEASVRSAIADDGCILSVSRLR